MAIVTDNSHVDQELIARILSGETHLFELFIKKYNQRLYRIAMAILGDDEEAEEVIQVTYVKAYVNLRRFEGKSSFATWLIRILINEALMAKKKRKHDSLDVIKEHQTETQHPMKTLLNHELKQIMEDAVAKLPAPYRLVFMMREIEGMSIVETKACLSISEANVKVRLNRAKEMLRNNLSQYVKCEDLYSFHLKRCEYIRKNVMARLSEFMN